MLWVGSLALHGLSFKLRLQIASYRAAVAASSTAG